MSDRIWTHQLIDKLAGRDIFDVARDAGCTQLQIDTIFMAAQGMTDAEIATRRSVSRIGVCRVRKAACRRIVRYLNTEVVKVV